MILVPTADESRRKRSICSPKMNEMENPKESNGTLGDEIIKKVSEFGHFDRDNAGLLFIEAFKLHIKPLTAVRACFTALPGFAVGSHLVAFIVIKPFTSFLQQTVKLI
jgi:hypothetical protein